MPIGDKKMPLAVYLKNFAGTLASKVSADKNDDTKTLPHMELLGTIINLLNEAMLAPNVP